MQQTEAAEAEDSSDDEAVQAPKSEMLVPATQQSIVEDLGEPSGDEDMEEEPPTASMVEDLGGPSESENE